MGILDYSVIIVLLLVQTLTQICLCTNSSIVCVESERQALFKLKRSFVDPYDRLSSWQGKYCCQWIGIGCDDNTGHVTKLDLRLDEAIEDGNFSRRLQARKVDTSLAELQRLRYLDIGGNDFGESDIPAFFGSMRGLVFLGLSRANFAGPIPRELGNLTNLQALQLRSGFDGLQADSFDWASNLESLRYLDMSGVNMSNIANTVIKVLASLPSLSHLNLSQCKLGNIHSAPLDSDSSIVFTSLEYLDLSSNSIPRESLDILRNMTSLRFLDLSENNLTSSVPSFLRSFNSLAHLNLANNYFDSIEGGGLLSILDSSSCSLRILDLSGNKIRSKVLEPDDLSSSNCSQYDMEFLDLGGCEITGPLSGWLEKLRFLKRLNLPRNSFYGPIPTWLGKFSSLTELDLSYNQLNGTVPETLGDLSSLKKLDVSHNHLEGNLPTSLGNLTNLEILDVSYNSLEGVVSEVHLDHLLRLRFLAIGSNYELALTTRSEWSPGFHLNRVQMSGCKIGPRFPKWLQTQNEITELDLSNTNISDSFPIWIQNMTSLSTLDLSVNAISGSLPANFGAEMPNLELLNLGSNLIDGSIPKSLCTFDWILVLDLSKNRFSGEIPDCWGSSRWLQFMILSGNKLTGTIPISIGHLRHLSSFHVNNNNLDGELPLSLANVTSLKVLDVGENQLRGAVPRWIRERLQSLKILRLRSNKFSGEIPRELCDLSMLKVLDVASNHFSGEIPRCFSNLTGMTTSAQKPKNSLYTTIDDTVSAEMVRAVMKGRELEYKKGTLRLLSYIDLSSNDFHGVIPDELCTLSALNGLNLSYNRFSGNIPDRIGNLKSLESLDLSHNHFSGNIPSTMASLTMLAFLDMSFNNLSGKVPTGNQLQTLDVDPSIYAGNPLLCGPTLPNKCANDKDDDDDSAPTTEEDDKSEKLWLYLLVTIGYITGLWVSIGTLFLKRNWRIAYFRFAEDAKDWVALLVSVNLRQLKNKLFNNVNNGN